MRYLCWWSVTAVVVLVLAGRGKAAEERGAEELPRVRRAAESREITPEDREARQKALEERASLRKAMSEIPPDARKRLQEALRARAPQPERAPTAARPQAARPPAVRRAAAAPAQLLSRDNDLRRMVLEDVLALTDPKEASRAEAERRIVALGRLAQPGVTEVFSATANRSLRDTLSSLLFVMGDYRTALPYVLRRTDNEVWGRITAKIMDLDADERLELVEALAELPEDLRASRQFQFLSFAVGDYRSPGKDLDNFESWFFIPCCTVGFRETLFRRRFGADEQSAGAIKERLLTKELDDQIKIFYLSYLSQDVPALLDVPALTALVTAGSNALREAVEKAAVETLTDRLAATIRALFEDKRYDSVASLIVRYDWKGAAGGHEPEMAALAGEVGCNAVLWRHIGESGDYKRLSAIAASLAACAWTSDNAATLLSGMAALMGDEAGLSSATKTAILSRFETVALAAGDMEEEARMAAAEFLHDAFVHIESPLPLTVSDENQDGWIGLIGSLAPSFEAEGGDRFLTWYAATPSTSRSTSSRTRMTSAAQRMTSAAAARLRTSGRSRVSEGLAAFTEELLDKVKSENGRANIASLMLRGVALGPAASSALVNDRRLPLDRRRQLVETESSNSYAMLFESFAALEELFPVVDERVATNLVGVLWPGEQKGAEYSLSDEDREQFIRLAVTDTRSAVLERVLKMKYLPRELCFAAAQDWLANVEPAVRAEAVKRLGSYATRDVVPLVLPLLADRESTVRSAAVSVLGSLAAVEAEGALVPLRSDPSAAVRAEVDKALATIGAVKSVGGTEEESTEEAAEEK